MQTPPPGSEPSNYPRQNLANDRQVLREVAASQRQILLCVLGQIGVAILNGVVTAAKMPSLAILVLIAILAVLVFMIMSVIRLAKALALSPVLYTILMFIPCVSLIALLMLSGKATARLSQAGIKVGLLGADPNSI
ncbi:hypothetical protein [Fimbriimonas ginsengisoli]|uniref:Uncharacterized protein n=1 Tax=Fimbriimonas ginsengisoli Gsoil 348 TaxID=661478 RepID=A0A068NV27_FIMGI|nr:hypothetical protein [Fimbriimonas ginsengisoli]AIE87306.1 hypothetical protein OP10G_3938 [Fimbriimonas ginsengisoli Gsoil 348]